MSGIVVLSGNPSSGSRAVRLATAVGTSVAQLLGSRPAEVIDLADYGQRLLEPGAQEVTGALAAVREADVLIVAMGAVHGTFAGLLKVFLDALPPAGLAGRTALRVVTAGSAEGAEAADGHLRTLLTELGANTPDPGLAVAEDRLAQSDVMITGYLDEIRSSLGVPSH